MVKYTLPYGLLSPGRKAEKRKNLPYDSIISAQASSHLRHPGTVPYGARKRLQLFKEIIPNQESSIIPDDYNVLTALDCP